MRFLFLTGMIATGLIGIGAATVSAQNGPPGQPPDPERVFTRLFISPMGEPFRSDRGGPNPTDMWFDGADTNHDGALTLAEFTADADRFFAVLDRGKDGEIDPDDIEFYETRLVPEIRTGGYGFGGGAASVEPWRRGSEGGLSDRFGGGHGGAGTAFDGDGQEAGPSSGQDGPPQPDYGSIRQGAARYSFFQYPEPVIVCDENFNRGVSLDEFRHCARKRFAALDENHDGKLLRAELPEINPPPAGRRPFRRSGPPERLPGIGPG